MTDKLTHDRSQKLMKFYEAYRTAFDATQVDGSLMPYNWWTLPNPLDGTWMVYSEMLSEFATELANIINKLTDIIRRLRAWDTVLKGLGDGDKHEVSHEFIDSLGTVALGLPYVIKSRFTYAVAYLSHQANRAADRRDWKDDLGEKFYLHEIEPYASKWQKYPAFKKKLEPLAGKEFKHSSHDFRHAYNHRFSPRFLVGITQAVKREEIDGEVRYAFGGTDPMTAAKVADLLAIERNHCEKAFVKFQALVEEQIAAIVAVENGGQAASGGRA